MNVQVTTIFDFTDETKLGVVNTDNKTIGVVSYEEKNEVIRYFEYETEVQREFDTEDDFYSWVSENSYRFKNLDGNCWIKYNANKNKKNTIDCTLRAYCKAEGITWDEAFDIAAKIAKENADMPDSNKVVDKVLTEYFGYTATKVKAKDKKTVNQFALEHPKGTYILGVRQHVVTVIDGKFYDTWNSGTRKVGVIYKKN